MTNHVDFALESGISVPEQGDNPVRLLNNRLRNLSPVGALVKKNIKSKVGDERSGKRNAIYSYILEGRICVTLIS